VNEGNVQGEMPMGTRHPVPGLGERTDPEVQQRPGCDVTVLHSQGARPPSWRENPWPHFAGREQPSRQDAKVVGWRGDTPYGPPTHARRGGGVHAELHGQRVQGERRLRRSVHVRRGHALWRRRRERDDGRHVDLGRNELEGGRQLGAEPPQRRRGRDTPSPRTYSPAGGAWMESGHCTSRDVTKGLVVTSRRSARVGRVPVTARNPVRPDAWRETVAVVPFLRRRRTACTLFSFLCDKPSRSRPSPRCPSCCCRPQAARRFSATWMQRT
jgi:hypothetical protein